ncbi:hypothetical protein V1504DRAFT_259210, partial [Lipomyces starkeyi]
MFITSVIRQGSFPQNAIVHPKPLCSPLKRNRNDLECFIIFVRSWPAPSLIYNLPEKYHKEKNQRSKPKG